MRRVDRSVCPLLGYTGPVRLRPPDPDYLKFLASYSDTIQKLALAARKLILEEAPEAGEFVYQVYTIADHFTFTDRPGDAFVFTTTHANWINLGFNFGRIAQPEDLDAPAIRELVRAAIAQAERADGRAGKPRTVVHRAQFGRKRSARSRT